MAKIFLIIAGIAVCAYVFFGRDEQTTSPMWDAAFVSTLSNDLVTANGVPAGASRLAGKDLVLIYFSAHWCPPCRTFTPELVQHYRDKGGHTKFEVIFVSRDHDEAAMLSYMQGEQMPWVATKFGSRSVDALAKHYAGKGIPCLVLVDKTGKVLSHSYKDGTYVGPHAVLADLERKL